MRKAAAADAEGNDMTEPRVKDCVFVKGSTDDKGRRGLPVLCEGRGCTGREHVAREFDCYIPITESLMPPAQERGDAL